VGAESVGTHGPTPKITDAQPARPDGDGGRGGATLAELATLATMRKSARFRDCDDD